jgi:hypothetical protein
VCGWPGHRPGVFVAGAGGHPIMPSAVHTLMPARPIGRTLARAVASRTGTSSGRVCAADDAMALGAMAALREVVLRERTGCR